jgi:hypothetical protein
MVNAALPRPPMARKVSSSPKVGARPAKMLVTACNSSPEASTLRSPSRPIKEPEPIADTKRNSAKALIARLASAAPTPNCLASNGIAGPMIPKPIVTKNEIRDRT